MTDATFAAGTAPRPIRVAGLLACLGAIPRLTIAVQAYLELGDLLPSRTRFIDFEPLPWVTAAFVAAHVWLCLSVWVLLSPRRRGVRPTLLWALVALVSLELSAVYGLTWLVRSHGLTVF